MTYTLNNKSQSTRLLTKACQLISLYLLVNINTVSADLGSHNKDNSFIASNSSTSFTKENRSYNYGNPNNQSDLSQQELLNTLFAYDDVRLKITDVLAEIVDEYEITDDYKKKLLGFRDTFLDKVKPARSTITNLDQFKQYTHSYSVVYISLIYTFHEDEEFYKILSKDIVNPSTTIGKYTQELESSYKSLVLAEQAYKQASLAYHD